jgi:hypothetical protein
MAMTASRERQRQFWLAALNDPWIAFPVMPRSNSAYAGDKLRDRLAKFGPLDDRQRQTPRRR